MKKIAFLTWGNGSQLRSFQDFAGYLDDMIYVGDMHRHDLSDYAAVVLPDAMDGKVMRSHAQQINDYVRGGGFLVAFACDGIADWLTVVDLKWKPINIRDWLWWTKPGGKVEVYQPEPHHPLCDVIPCRDMSWHWAGVFELTNSAQSILNLDNDEGSIFLDFNQIEGGGRVLITTLDPHVHNGERFMPATTRFLQAFYPWLSREVGIERTQREYTVTYLQCYSGKTEWQPAELTKSFEGTNGTLRFEPLYKITDETFRQSDIVYVPNNQDQIFLREKQDLFTDHLKRGKHLIICSEPAIAWLPFLKPFQPVSPRPFTNLKVRVADERFGFFANMPDGFDGWCGIFGQYARGWTEMPDGGVALTHVGSADEPKPSDWLWQYPLENGKGGKVFMHNGDNMFRYPDHGPYKELLVREVCDGLINHRLTTLHPQSSEIIPPAGLRCCA